jgi:hypothetical protein
LLSADNVGGYDSGSEIVEVVRARGVRSILALHLSRPVEGQSPIEILSARRILEGSGLGNVGEHRVQMIGWPLEDGRAIVRRSAAGQGDLRAVNECIPSHVSSESHRVIPALNRCPEILDIRVRDVIVVVDEGHVFSLGCLEKLLSLETDARFAVVKGHADLVGELGGKTLCLLVDGVEKLLETGFAPSDGWDQDRPVNRIRLAGNVGAEVSAPIDLIFGIESVMFWAKPVPGCSCRMIQ